MHIGPVGNSYLVDSGHRLIRENVDNVRYAYLLALALLHYLATKAADLH